jgi:hypothetical protein
MSRVRAADDFEAIYRRLEDLRRARGERSTNGGSDHLRLTDRLSTARQPRRSGEFFLKRADLRSDERITACRRRHKPQLCVAIAIRLLWSGRRRSHLNAHDSPNAPAAALVERHEQAKTPDAERLSGHPLGKNHGFAFKFRRDFARGTTARYRSRPVMTDIRAILRPSRRTL